MAALLEYKCPNCGGNIKFDSSSQKFKCDSCGTFFTKEQLDENEKNVLEQQKSVEGQSTFNWNNGGNNDTIDHAQSYICKSCGAEIIGDGSTAASSCPYCGSPVVMADMLSGLNKPDYVIPFKITEKDAGEALKKFYKGKMLIPKSFALKNKVKEIKGMYVPFWLFDCKAQGSAAFDATRIKRWSDANNDYVQTFHFNVFRSGEMEFDNIPVDGSSKMDDGYMDSIEPFNYGDMTEFNMSYLSGFLADKYDVDAQASFPRANGRVINSAVEALASTVNGYDSVCPTGSCINAEGGSYKYALLPVYMMNTKYNNKMYTFAINGQTGKTTGEIPFDKGKYWAWFAAIAAVIIAIGQFFIF